MADTKTAAGKVAAYVAEFAVSRLPKVAPALSSTMIRLMDIAIDGFGVFPGAKKTAGKVLQRKQDVALAVDGIIHSHTAMAAAQGVAANLGGIVSAIIGTPINITGIVTVQIRMVACIAHLYGYDIDDPRVRTALAMCLLGERELERQISDGRLPTTPLTVATSPIYDPALHTTVAERVLSNILSEAAGKGIVTAIGRKAPLIGGGVGGAADGLDTYMVSRCVRKHLVPRRMMEMAGYQVIGAQ
ncbi:MAG: hypothetical protein LBV00_12135 [Propionibacteriaceae bacterium]|jgi:uncharacterized protein (DUF697 family)|nr:hypothetical protein [Propionibacteriaceae bacterium]